MNMIAGSLSRPGASTRLSTIRTTKDRADDASPAVRDAMSPAVRDAMLAAIPRFSAFAISLSRHVDRADDPKLAQDRRRVAEVGAGFRHGLATGLMRSQSRASGQM